jgi:FkbH-like protein
MIDDNPVERSSMQSGMPGVRVLGRHLYYLKRILLWSPESQQPVITGESSRKTEMAQAQLQRESTRKTLSHEDFLNTLNVRVSVSIVEDTKDLNMNRALELFNKTNQFNTIGARYTLEQCHQQFVEGRRLYVLQAEDRFTQYGLIGAAWVHENCINHMVMSCRALGLGIEDAFLAHVANRLSTQNAMSLHGRLQPTDANTACRQLYSRNGFIQERNDPVLWSRPLNLPVATPSHISLTAASEEPVGNTSN